MGINEKEQEQNRAQFKSYAKNKQFVIVDSSKVSRSAVGTILQQLGTPSANITQATSFQSAVEEIARVEPQVIITDYDVETRCGLDLRERQRKHRPDNKDGLFILVTANTSQSAVARATEEDVDTYILKPFTTEGLRQSLMKAALSKLHPNPYMLAIEQGKIDLADGLIDKAIHRFGEATKLDPAPALAYFYSGQAHLARQALSEAEASYQKGLTFVPIHYKCLVGLYELLMSQNRYHEAYTLLRTISHHFPAKSQRLIDVLHLAIRTKNYQDVEEYQRFLAQIYEQNDDVIRYLGAALVVTGKFYIQQGETEKAIEVLNKAALISAARTNILREAIRVCSDGNLMQAAEALLKRFPPDAREDLDFLLSDFLVANKVSPAADVVEKGLKLIAKDYDDAQFYELLIKRAGEAKMQRILGDLVDKAIAKWPEKRNLFEAAAYSDVGASPLNIARPTPAK